MLKRIVFLSLFPEVIRQGLEYSLLEKARAQGKIDFHFIQIRDYAKDKHRSVDDALFGGGPGMLMKPDVLFEAWQGAVRLVKSAEESTEKTREHPTAEIALEPKTESPDTFLTVFLSPQGKIFSQEYAKSCVHSVSSLILVCGHYEGVDERFIEECVDQEWSIGDYVLTGGEYPALVVSDVLVRLLPGVVGNEHSVPSDSLEDGLLKYPQYTRPREFLGKTPPEVLFSGNHAAIEKWRTAESLKRTKQKRPDLFEQFQLKVSKNDQIKA